MFKLYSSKWLWPLAVMLLVGVALIAIVTTYPAVSATYDEPFHIGIGMSWLDKGSSSYSAEQPPLAQSVVALGPYFKGLHSSSLNDPTDAGNAVLSSNAAASTNLAWARSGNLLFFALACFVVVLWGRRWFGRATALWALLLFVSLPPIIGHAGLATVDLACVATVALALYAFIKYLENARTPKVLFLGAALAFAFLCKFSSIAFLGLSIVLTGVYFFLKRPRAKPLVFEWRPLLKHALLLGAVMFTVLWAGYRFSCQPVTPPTAVHPGIDRLFARTPYIRSVVYRTAKLPVPLGTMGLGIYAVKRHNEGGSDSYLLGKYRSTGWWYFFPVVVGVKTPIGFLILAFTGLLLICRRANSNLWQRHLTVLFPLSITLVCLTSRIDLGVRHILAIYPFLALMAGYAVSEFFLFAKRSKWIATLPVLLVIWIVADCWFANPDYLAYFNEFAGGHPERLLAESDLDWGQDLGRLSRRLRDLHASHVSIKYFGTAQLEKAGLPTYSLLSPCNTNTKGYLAVSVRYLTLDFAKDGSFAWLRAKTPKEIVGKSIYLYDLGR